MKDIHTQMYAQMLLQCTVKVTLEPPGTTKSGDPSHDFCLASRFCTGSGVRECKVVTKRAQKDMWHVAPPVTHHPRTGTCFVGSSDPPSANSIRLSRMVRIGSKFETTHHSPPLEKKACGKHARNHGTAVLSLKPPQQLAHMHNSGHTAPRTGPSGHHVYTAEFAKRHTGTTYGATEQG